MNESGDGYHVGHANVNDIGCDCGYVDDALVMAYVNESAVRDFFVPKV